MYCLQVSHTSLEGEQPRLVHFIMTTNRMQVMGFVKKYRKLRDQGQLLTIKLARIKMKEGC